jgi:hypothetical protein
MNLLISNSIHLFQNAIQLAYSTGNGAANSSDLGAARPAEAAGDADSLRRSDGQSSDNGETDADGSSADVAAAAGAKSRQADEQLARLKMKRFSSSALCLNNDEAGADQPDDDQATRFRCRQQTGAGGSGKRSAVAVRHRREPARLGAGADATNATSATDAAGSKRSGRVGGGGDSTTAAAAKRKQPTITVSELAPAEDPVVQLARQRRPSVSNQGSLNVDQQGE